MASRKHFTDLDKKIFKEILRKYAHVIESKASNASTLREKEVAWAEIANEFNNATLISQTRTTQQLRKLWSNMKQVQRDALTAERQAIRGTGGGPMAPPAFVDPDIAMIAPDLLTTAPVIYSSSMTSAEIANQNDEVLDAVASGQSMSSIISGNRAVDELETNDSANDSMEAENMVNQPSTSSAVQQSGNADELHVNYSAASHVDPLMTSSTNRQNIGRRRRRVRRSPSPEMTEEALRIKRMNLIIKREEELGEMKKKHTEQLYALEIIAAKATADRAVKLLRDAGDM